MFDLRTYLAACRERVDGALNEVIQASSGSRRLVDAMRHSLMAGGKRLRPVLCMAAAEAVGGRVEDVLPAACAIEMIHTYSLIHDDLPAMDDDELRRGQPTCHIAFDEATAILAGDALLTLAFDVLSSAGSRSPARARQWLEVMHRIAVAAGHQGMIEGQMRDMASENMPLTVEDLQTLHTLKTGALIRASVESGAILGGGSSEQVAGLGVYAQHIGLAFQVTDDILNVEGDPEVMGKAVGTDERRHKNTYPSLMGIEKSKAFANGLIDNALHALVSFDKNAQPLLAVARYIIDRKR